MRKLNKDELDIVKTLLLSSKSEYHKLLSSLEEQTVKELKDGGMGSLQFVSREKQTLCKTIAEAEFNDKDGVPVFVSLGIDLKGELFELDVWKADFSAVESWPPIENIRVVAK